MAITREAYWMMCRTLYVEPDRKASVLQIGRQGSTFTFPEMRRMLRAADLPVPIRRKSGRTGRFAHLATDEEMFRGLGYAVVHALDISTYEGAELEWDLNLPIPPGTFGRGYDLIVDGGTGEHVFDTKTYLANLHELTAANGKIMHYTPANNYVDHGFYQFSPSLFNDYYTANGYRRVGQWLIRSFVSDHRRRLVYDYSRHQYEQLSSGGWSRAMLSNYCVVERTEGATAGVVPTQSRYEDLLWSVQTVNQNRSAGVKALLGIASVRQPRLYHFAARSWSGLLTRKSRVTSRWRAKPVARI